MSLIRSAVHDPYLPTSLSDRQLLAARQKRAFVWRKPFETEEEGVVRETSKRFGPDKTAEARYTAESTSVDNRMDYRMSAIFVAPSL